MSTQWCEAKTTANAESESESEGEAETPKLEIKKTKNLNKVHTENVIIDIEVIEEDIENVEQKCEKINWNVLYDAVIATLKLVYDLIFCCCKKKDNT